jgi:hypothetical protein
MDIDEMLDKKDELEVKEGIITETSEFDIKKIKKAFKWKTIVTAVIAATVFILVSVGAVLGGVLGSAASYAKNSIKYSWEYAENQALVTATQEVTTEYPGLITDLATIRVSDTDLHLDVKTPLNDSKYIYRIEFVTDGGLKIEVHVDSKTGLSYVDDIDFD